MTNLFVLTLPIVIVVDLLLGLIVLLNNRRRLTNRVFALHSVAFAIWLSGQYFGSTTPSEVWLAFWIRQTCAASVFIPFFFNLLRAAAACPAATILDLLRQSKVWFVSVIAIALLSQTQFFLVGARLAAKGNEIGEPIYGPGFIIFVGFWLTASVALIVGFFKALTRSEGVYRMELKILAYGSLFALVPGVIIVLVIPLITGSSQSARFTPITVVIWHCVIAYGIATRHIMGVGEFLRRTLIWVFVGIFLSLLYLAVFRFVVSIPFDGARHVLNTLAHVVAAIAMTLCFNPCNNFLRDRTDRLFEQGHDNLSQFVREGGNLARSITTIDTLFSDFVRLLREALNITHTRIYLREGNTFIPYNETGSEDRHGEPIPDDAPLVCALQAETFPLLRDVLRRAGGTALQADAERALARLDAEAAVALKSKNGLAGFLLLGRRQNGRIFGKREEDALAFLGDQLGFAIENATLYTRLQDARLYNEVLLDNLVTGVVATDADGRITVCNREAQRILHVAETKSIIGMPVSKILPKPIWDELRGSLDSGTSVRDRDLVLRQHAPNEQSVRFATAVFGGENSAVSGALLVIQDTSAIRKLEAQIRRNDRLASIGTLAAGMAHEIKNPLVCLKTFVQLLPSHYEDPDFRQTFVPLLGNEVERINAIVSQLLNFSRPVKPTLVPLSLQTTLDDAWQLVAQQIKSRGLSFVRDYHAKNDRLLGDKGLLSQVFLNLFLNGMDAMDRGGTLTISTNTVCVPLQSWQQGQQQDREWIEVRVRDTGCGIALEDRQRIFDPFFTSKANGTGLGLSVTHGIIAEHQGMIDVESEPGAGTCFRILLPLLITSREASQSIQPETKGEA